MQVRLLVGKIPWKRKRHPTAVFLPGESRRQRSLAATVHGVAKSQIRLNPAHSTEYVLIRYFNLSQGSYLPLAFSLLFW